MEDNTILIPTALPATALICRSLLDRIETAQGNSKALKIKRIAGTTLDKVR